MTIRGTMKVQETMKILARVVALGVLVGVLGLTALIGVAQAAQNDLSGDPSGGTSPGGYTAMVEVSFTGEGVPGGGGRLTKLVRVAPTCWWEPAGGPHTDAAASLAWYDEVTGGLQTRGVIDEYGPRRIWEEAAAAEAAGSDLAWYRATCVDAKDLERYDPGASEGVDPILGDPTDAVTYYYRTFAAGAELPAPLVDPEQLALAAREIMEIPEPVTERNPRIQSAGAPTLVGLPTWFWVTEEEAVGGADGDRDITATLGDVSATVTAVTDGLTLKSPAGGESCEPSRALVKYASGASEENACTVVFTRASVAYPGGYPVAASTAWQATWEGSDGTDGTLEGLARDVVAAVPVAEVQNIVTRR